MESHGEDLREIIGNDLTVEQIKEDYTNAELTARERILCEFAEKLTRTPSAMTPQDLEQLRSAGLSDEEIHDAVQVISYFNYINRLADALGCDPEPWMKRREGD
jgi:uncharacterized peroxidase-related enzyme